MGNNYYSAAQIRAAYGVNAIPDFGTATPDGTGQTIAIIDAGNDPDILTDLDGFDKAMTTTLIGTSPSLLYQNYGPSSSILSDLQRVRAEHHPVHRHERQQWRAPTTSAGMERSRSTSNGPTPSPRGPRST